uniref:MYND-type domain-containing protein n=1 Tax=Romanomermis culicivorax TaxID=13658 RepID=A0A915I218_ROMCU
MSRMNSFAAGRSVSADDIRHLWTAVKICQSQNLAPTRSSLIQHLTQNNLWRPDDAEVKLQHCLECGVVNEKINPNLGQDVLVICPPEEAPNPRPDHDWYCFYCHGEGNVLKCQHCWRVYHPACLSAIGIMEKPKGFTCLPCLTLQKVNKLALEGQTPDMSLVHSKIEVLLNWIDSTAPSIFDTLPDDSCEIAEEQAQWLIYEHIDLNQIKQKNRTYVYDIHQFLIDFELLAHVVILLYGKESTQGDVVNTILKDIKKEVEAFESGLMAAVPGRSDYMDDSSYETGKKRRKMVDGAMDQSSDMMRNTLPKETAVRQPTFMTSADMQNMLNVPPGQCGCDAKYKQLLLELQQHWLNEFKADREKSMLHRDFTLEQEKTQADTMNRFKQELEATRKELDQRYTSQLKQEIQKLNEKHKKQLSETKKKQWCWQCEAEAIYHCCWNTAYCSVECQQQHWPQHRKLCRRKKQQNQN